MTHDWSQLVRELTLALVRLPSVTGTPGEVRFAEELHTMLAAHPYFCDHPQEVWRERIPTDPHNRENVYSLVRGGGRATVVLSGHYDVVDVANYGMLVSWAFDPEVLLPRLIAQLEQETPGDADARTLADLQSGNYLPGRGVLDMKSGLAAGIAVQAHFAAATSRTGNILLIATPDEEESSHGMRAAAERLPSLAQEWDLDPIAAINLDVTVDHGDGHDGQVIFLGSVGKVLPAVYLVGRETHAGAPFDGVNPNLLAAEITRRVECNVELCDIAEGEAAPPPVTLTQVDLKQRYDVTTPAAAWCAYNVLTHGRTAAEVLPIMQRLVTEALDQVLAHLREQARHFATLGSYPYTFPSWQPQVLTFAELRARALERGGAPAAEALKALTTRLEDDRGVDLPHFSRRVVELLWAWSGLTGPAAVIGLASLYYPPVLVSRTSPRHTRVREVVAAQAANLARDYGVLIRLRPFLPGISDMSFLGCAEAPHDLAVMAANTPAWGTRIRYNYGTLRTMDLPVINVGPWGRDYHQRTERVYTPYAFEVVPELIWRIVHERLDEQNSSRA